MGLFSRKPYRPIDPDHPSKLVQSIRVAELPSTLPAYFINYMRQQKYTFMFAPTAARPFLVLTSRGGVIFETETFEELVKNIRR